MKLKSDLIKQIELEDCEILPSHKHQLKRFVTDHDRYCCNKNKEQFNCLTATESLPKDSVTYSCSDCNFNLCIDCAKADKFASTDFNLLKIGSKINFDVTQ